MSQSPKEAHTDLVTGAQMSRIDRRAIDGGISGQVLMETAGRGVYRVLQDVLEGVSEKNLVILCGKGNNGGDGFVVARLANQDGARVRLFLLAKTEEIQGDAKYHLDRLKPLTVELVPTTQSLKAIRQALACADLVVDALLGTGIRGTPRGLIADAIHILNEATCPLIAVDLPSGLNADTGKAGGPCPQAKATVTFGQPRRGHFIHPGRALSGSLHLVDIGIPAGAVEAEGVQTHLIAAHGGSALLPHRAPDAHKGDCGRVVILAGSVGLTGAAVLSTKAALRGGAGLVILGVPKSLNDILEVQVTEAMTRPLPEVRSARCLSLRARGEIQRLIQNANSVAIGPGLGTHPETGQLLKRLLPDLAVPTVLDADALNALSGNVACLKNCSAPLVLTPHPGEFKRLTGQKHLDNPLEAARNLATQIGVTLVLKGAPTIVATPSGEAFVNPSGNAGMATGGSGDVLTGLIASLLAQGLDTVRAACLGVYWHGMAGDIVSETHGQAGLIAGDLIHTLPVAEQQIRANLDKNRYIQLYPHNPTKDGSVA